MNTAIGNHGKLVFSVKIYYIVVSLGICGTKIEKSLILEFKMRYKHFKQAGKRKMKSMVHMSNE
jgi:hypothetical protein